MLTFAVYLQDHPGALNRVASLFLAAAAANSAIKARHG